MATQFSIIAWEIPWTEEPDGLQSMGLQKSLTQLSAEYQRSLSHIQFFYNQKDFSSPHLQAPLPMGFSRQEYWSGLPFPSLRNLPNQGIEPTSPAWQADSLPLSYLGRPGDDDIG